MFVVIAIFIVLPIIFILTFKALSETAKELQVSHTRYSQDDFFRQQKELEKAYNNIVLPATGNDSNKNENSKKHSSYIRQKQNEVEKVMKKPEGLTILCGEEKETWLKSIIPNFTKTFPAFKFTVNYASGERAINILEKRPQYYDV